MVRLKLGALLEKLTVLASEPDPTNMDHVFWTDPTPLARALRDGMESLMFLASEEDVGWMLNAGWRCDVDRDRFSIDVCDLLNRKEPGMTLHAATAQGALAAGILAVLQARIARKTA
jgi:hypothetical protein